MSIYVKSKPVTLSRAANRPIAAPAQRRPSHDGGHRHGIIAHLPLETRRHPRRCGDVPIASRLRTAYVNGIPDTAPVDAGTGFVESGRAVAGAMSASVHFTALRKEAMRNFKEQNLDERLDRAAKAKQAILEKFKQRPSDNDPEVIRRRQQQIAIAEARAKREAEKNAIKAQEAAERAEREAKEKAERQKVERRQAIERVIMGQSSEAEQKAKRDARYAARKARAAARR